MILKFLDAPWETGKSVGGVSERYWGLQPRLFWSGMAWLRPTRTQVGNKNDALIANIIQSVVLQEISVGHCAMMEQKKQKKLPI